MPSPKTLQSFLHHTKAPKKDAAALGGFLLGREQQTLHLHEGGVRILTPFGAVDVNVDPDNFEGFQGISAGPGMHLHVQSPFAGMTVAQFNETHTVLRMVPDKDSELSPKMWHLQAPAIDAYFRLATLHDALLEIARHKDDPEHVTALVNDALANAYDRDGDNKPVPAEAPSDGDGLDGQVTGISSRATSATTLHTDGSRTTRELDPS